MSAPIIEPVTLEQAKLYVRSDAPEDDPLLSRLIVAARQEAENITGRVLVGAGADSETCPELCPEPIRQWMLARIATWYEQREAIAVGANLTVLGRSFVDSLLDPYVLPAVF